MKDAGFTPGELQLVAVGTLTRKEGLLTLEMSGVLREFALAGGAKAEELMRRNDLLGKRLRVAGRAHPYHADRPPELTVESFQTLPK